MSTPRDEAQAALLEADEALARLAAHECWPEATRERPELTDALLATWKDIGRADEDLARGWADAASVLGRASRALAFARYLEERICERPWSRAGR